MYTELISNLPTSVVTCNVKWPPVVPVLRVDSVPDRIVQVQVPDALQQLYMIRLGSLVPGRGSQHLELVIVQHLDEALIRLFDESVAEHKKQ